MPTHSTDHIILSQRKLDSFLGFSLHNINIDPLLEHKVRLHNVRLCSPLIFTQGFFIAIPSTSLFTYICADAPQKRSQECWKKTKTAPKLEAQYHAQQNISVLGAEIHLRAQLPQRPVQPHAYP